MDCLVVLSHKQKEEEAKSKRREELWRLRIEALEEKLVRVKSR